VTTSKLQSVPKLLAKLLVAGATIMAAATSIADENRRVMSTSHSDP